MAPMIFFSFETVSCYQSSGYGNDQCVNTSNAALWLSTYLNILTAVSIASKAVSREERGEGLTYENLAILRLKKRQKIQGTLGIFTALASMYLFSVLKVDGEPNESIYWIGAVGAVALGLLQSLISLH